MSHRAPNAIQSDTERNPIRRRTQSNRTPNATRLDSERNPIGHRTRTDQIPNANRCLLHCNSLVKELLLA